MGSDYPFAIRQKQPGAFAKHALGSDAVLAENAFGFLGRSYEVASPRQAAAEAIGGQGSAARG